MDLQAHVGSKRVLSEKRTLRVHFHDFEELKHDKGHSIESEPLCCHGCAWTIRLYPRGSNNAKEDRVSCFLILKSCQKEELPLIVDFSICAGSRNLSCRRIKFKYLGFSNGYDDLLKRTCVLDSTKGFLDDGTLSIKVDIQVHSELPAAWKPPSSFSDDILSQLNKKETCDVTFQVQGTDFYAHKFLLTCRAPALAVLCQNADKDEKVELKFDPDRFYSFLYFIYSGRLPEDENLKKNAMELLQIADRFGCVGLKLMAEAELVESGIDVESASDLILFADSKNCALLKEATFHFFILHSASVMKTEGYGRLKESNALLSELMEASLGSGKETSESLTSVSDLRKRLYDAGEEVDGTKEVLVKRIKGMQSDS